MTSEKTLEMVRDTLSELGLNPDDPKSRASLLEITQIGYEDAVDEINLAVQEAVPEYKVLTIDEIIIYTVSTAKQRVANVKSRMKREAEIKLATKFLESKGIKPKDLVNLSSEEVDRILKGE